MGRVDRLGDAARPTNSIREATGADLSRASPAPAAGPPQQGPPAPAAAKKPADRTASDPLAGTHYLEDTGGERRYYEDYRRRSLALRAGDSTISSKREDIATIRAMLALAEARGWTAIAIRGSAGFRRRSAAASRTRHTEAAAGSAGSATAPPPVNPLPPSASPGRHPQGRDRTGHDAGGRQRRGCPGAGSGRRRAPRRRVAPENPARSVAAFQAPEILRRPTHDRVRWRPLPLSTEALSRPSRAAEGFLRHSKPAPGSGV